MTDKQLDKLAKEVSTILGVKIALHYNSYQKGVICFTEHHYVYTLNIEEPITAELIVRDLLELEPEFKVEYTLRRMFE